MGSLHTHTRSCGYTTVSCTNHCERLQPSLKLLQKDLATHQEVCPARTHQCPHCSIMGPYQELTTSHLDTCPKVEVQCPNPACNMKIQRCYFDVHKATCQNVLRPCKFFSVGCSAQLRLVELQTHEQDDQLHLQMTKEKVLQLTEYLEVRERRLREHVQKMTRDIATLKQRLPALRRNQHPVTFKFQGFDMHKLQDKAFKSPAFYLSTGYRFQMQIFANGRGRGANTHISLFVHLLQGCNDDFLTWPFEGILYIAILNQLEDKGHIWSTIQFSSASNQDIGRRVTSKRRELSAWGKEEFVSNKQLANITSKRQYLKNDTLYFRVNMPQ